MPLAKQPLIKRPALDETKLRMHHQGTEFHKVRSKATQFKRAVTPVQVPQLCVPLDVPSEAVARENSAVFAIPQQC